MPRGNSRTGANPDRVMERVNALLAVGHPVDVSAADVELDKALPLDLMEDPAKTRAIIARLGRD